MIRGQKDIPEDAAFDILLHDKMLQYRSIMPGVINKINYAGDSIVSVDVQPAIGLLTSDDGRVIKKEPLPVINECPLVLPYAPTSGLSITLPLAVGDNCLLLCADRSIDNWQLEGGLQYPVEPTLPRTRDLTDAICLPCMLNNKTTIDKYSAEKIEIRNKDRTTVVSVSDESIELLQADKKLSLSSDGVEMFNLSATITLTPSALISTVPIEAPGYAGASGGPSNFTSDINMGGNNINNAGAITGGGVNLTTHNHTDSTGGQTSDPE